MSEVLSARGARHPRSAGSRPWRRFDLEPSTRGELVGLIGPNGAGKTTVFNMLTGVYTPTEGAIAVRRPADPGAQAATRSAACGIARTFQNIRLFGAAVSTTCAIGAALPARRRAWLGAALRTTRASTPRRSCMAAEADAPARGDGPDRRRPTRCPRTSPTASSGGWRSRARWPPAAAAAARRARGRHEPAARSADLMELIQEIRAAFDVAMLLIEHDMKLVMGICERIAVLDYGVKIARGHAGGDPRATRRSSRPTWARTVKAARSGRLSCWRSTIWRSPTARSRRCSGVDLRRPRGRDRHADRRERRRQDDAAAHDLRPGQAAVGHDRLPQRSAAGSGADRRPPHEIVALGISHAPGGAPVFANMTVEDNLELGAYLRKDSAVVKTDLERCSSSSRA